VVRNLFCRVILVLGILSALQMTWADESPWTYFFAINGDFLHTGPDYSNHRRIKVVDQAQALYEQVNELARQDRLNHYVIFYDPKGSGHWFSNAHVRLDIYKQGRRVRSNSRRVKEIDFTRPESFQHMVDEALHHLQTELSDGNKLLYFYGEHIGAFHTPLHHGKPVYDLSAIGSEFTFVEFFEGISHFQKVGGIDLLVMHSCHMNTASFLRRAFDFANHVLVAREGIPNAPLSLQSLLRNSLQAPERARLLVAENPSGDHPFDLIAWDKQSFVNFAQLLRKAERKIAVHLYNQDHAEKIRAGARIEQFESIRLAAFELPFTQELLVNIQDYIRLIEQYALTDDDPTFLKLYDLLEDKPQFTSLYELIRLYSYWYLWN